MKKQRWLRLPRLRTGLLLLASAMCASIAFADAYPDKPIRLVVPFPAGGPTDMVARPLAQFLGEQLKQSVIVDNRGGAGGGIGAEVVAKAPADGYTLLMATVGTQAINATLYRKLGYDPVKDFTPISLVAAAPVALVVHPSVPVRSVAELIALAYKGSAPALSDLLGGQIQLMFDPLQSVLARVRAGRLKLLAISSKTRSPAAPDVPTFAESGLKDFEATAWWAVFAPASLPPAIAARLNTSVNAVVNSPAFRALLEPQGVTVLGDSREALAQFQRSEIGKWGNAVRASGASVD